MNWGRDGPLISAKHKWSNLLVVKKWMYCKGEESVPDLMRCNLSVRRDGAT